MALTDRDKKMLIVLGVVAGLAVLFLLFQMLTGGGEEDTTTAGGSTTTDTATVTPDGTATTAPEPSPSLSLAPVPVAEGPVLSGRDFFSPLPPQTPSVVASPTDGETTEEPSTVDSSATIDGSEVTLEDIVEKKKGDEVDMTVDGSSWPGNGVGDTFAKYYTVNGINPDDGCADFQFDKKGAAESFKLCLT